MTDVGLAGHPEHRGNPLKDRWTVLDKQVHLYTMYLYYAIRCTCSHVEMDLTTQERAG